MFEPPAGEPRTSAVALHEGLERRRVVWMPAREGRAVLDDVAGSPEDAALIDRPRDVVVRAEDVEIPRRETVQHEVDGLLRRPGGLRLRGPALGGQWREDEARDQ